MENISRKELVSYTWSIQKNIRKHISRNATMNLWKEKFRFLSQQKWSAKEAAHLAELEKRIEIDIFESNEYKLRSFKEFADNWAVVAINDLGWSERQIRIIGMTFYVNEEEATQPKRGFSGVTLRELGSMARISGEVGECNCALEDPWWCGNDPCVKDYISGCEPDCWPGCGWFLIHCCFGYCPGS